MMMKTRSLIFFLCIAITFGFDRRFLDRLNADENNDQYGFLRRRFDDSGSYLELRTMDQFDRRSATGPVITLENSAWMTTRLRVLYTDDKCSPFLAETGRIWTKQTEKLTLPANALHVKISVEKEIFVDQWREVYNGTLEGQSKCIRITGLTFTSSVEKCE